MELQKTMREGQRKLKTQRIATVRYKW